jgi:tight adherence protein C
VLFANLLDLEKLLPLAIFGLFAVVAWWLLGVVAGRRTRADERLEVFSNPTKRRDEKGKNKGAMSGMIERATPALAKPLQPKSERDIGKLKLKLCIAGFRGEAAPSLFLGLKFIGLVIGLFLCGGPMLLFGGATQKTLMYVVITAGGLFYLPDIVVWWIARGRKQQIFLTLPDALDLLVVCVEAGLGLDQAMRKVSEEMKRTARVICDEFNLCNFQLQMGRGRSEVLHELGQRTGVDDLRALAAILIQADKFGSSIAQALRVQSDSMRTRRRQLAEEKAAKTAVKLIFPLVIFIFPGIFVVLVGPAAITMVREMFPAMSGGR